MEQEQEPPLLNRLKCHCVFSETARELEEIMGKLRESAKKNKHSVAIRQTQSSLSALRKLYEEHVSQHRVAWNRSFCDYYKGQSVFSPNVNAYNSHVLRTSAYKAGDVDLLRAPVVKVSKKNKKKRMMQAAPAPAPTGPTGPAAAAKRTKVKKEPIVKIEQAREEEEEEEEEINIPPAIPIHFVKFGGRK